MTRISFAFSSCERLSKLGRRPPKALFLVTLSFRKPLLTKLLPAVEKNSPTVAFVRVGYPASVTYIAWCVYMRDMAREMLQPSLMSASPTLSHDIPVPQPSDHLFWPEQPSSRLYSVGRPLPKNS
jgi:hypothetical protein